jgi:hypothetical protein
VSPQRPLTQHFIAATGVKAEYQILEWQHPGWILRRNLADEFWMKMCWLIPDLCKQGVLAYSGERVCIGLENGMITIIDFSTCAAIGSSALVP